MDSPAIVKRRRTREDRRRTARACDRCRRLKERCEGGFPCTRCIHLGRHCEFKRLPSQHQESDLLPPLVASPTVSGPEVNVPELLERVTYMENILKHKFRGIALDVDSLRRMSRALEHEQSINRPATPLLAEEDPIEEEVCTINPVEDTTTHYSGEFSYWNFSMRVKRHIEDRMHPQRPLQVSNYWRAEQLHSGVSSIAAAISCCPPRHIADFLLNVFFKHAQTYYFYVDKAWLIARTDELYRDPGRFTKKSSAVVSILLMVLAIATQYAYLDAQGHKASGTSSEYSEDALGTMFYQQAISFLPEIIETSSLESVQACLLFAVYALSIDASGLGYIYITLTNRLGMQNGMHREYSGTGLSDSMIETRNRVWWTAYTLERKISIFHGRPLSTQQSDVDAPLPAPGEGVLDDGPSSLVPYVIASVELTKRLESFSKKMFLLRTTDKHERSSILLQLAAAKEGLIAWWTKLPIHGEIQHSNCRVTTHLRLEYCLVRMFLGRPLLLHRASSHTPTSPGGSVGRSPGSNMSDTSGKCSSSAAVRKELVECCVLAAEEALNLCRGLRDNGPGLARASYIEYSSCRASLLVLIAHSIERQSTQFRAQLRDGLDMIREMAAAGDSARSEVALIESLDRALARLLHATDNNSDTRSDSGYEHFKHWESAWKSGAALPLPEGTTSVAANAYLPYHDPFVELPEHREGSSRNTLSHNTHSIPSLISPPATGMLPLDSNHPEFRVLQEFLAYPGYRFDPGIDTPALPF